MKNISFDNPYILLVAIPLLLAILIPYFIAINKENKSKSTLASLIIHILIVFVASVAMAGTVYTHTITRTEVIVLADVSASTEKDFDKIDEYIKKIDASVDENASNYRLAVVAFGRDCELLTDFGKRVKSVSNSSVDGSATDIASALNYAATLFDERSVKRVVIITDGRQTGASSNEDFVRAVDSLYAMGAQVDAMYLNENIEDNAREVQVSGVDYNKSAYRGHSSTADILIQSGYDNAKGILTVKKDGEEIDSRTLILSKGFNIVNIDLKTDEDGEFDYKIEVSIIDEGGEDCDILDINNSISFTQRVSGKLNVLLITTKTADIAEAKRLYGENAEIDVYCNKKKVPFTVEELCKYDEIIISETDVRDLENCATFINSLDTVVSKFGKTLLTFGNNQLQNKNDEELEKLQNMLPVNFGNGNQDQKFVTILLDMSLSMDQAGREIAAKELAIKLLDILNDDDLVSVVYFWGDVRVSIPTPAINRDAIAKEILRATSMQGTRIDSALQKTFELMQGAEQEDKQVILISDGISHDENDKNSAGIAANMRANGIYVKVVNVYSQIGEAQLNNISYNGCGKPAYKLEGQKLEDIEAIVNDKISDDINDTVIENRKGIPVSIAYPNADILKMSEITALPYVYGFTVGKEKQNATTVLTVNYEKSSGGTVAVPLYAEWDYGNGRVSTFTSSLTGNWVNGWNEGSGADFINNMIALATPEEKIDYPFNFRIDCDSIFADIEIIPETLKPGASAVLTITLPNGEAVEETLKFNSSSYAYKLATPEVGKYNVKLVYSYTGKEFTVETAFHVSRLAEYDAFAVYSSSPLHKAIRNRGSVTADGTVPKYDYTKNELETYTVDFTVPFLVSAIALFVLDVIIRKLKWNDIKGLFKKSMSKKGAKNEK